MGAVADFTSVPDAIWPAVLPCVRAAGIAVQGGERERGITWYTCARGMSRVALGYSPQDGGREVVVYALALRFWRRPLGMWRLFRDVRRAVRAAGGKSATL